MDTAVAQLVARQRAERGGDPPPSSVLPSPPALRGPFTVEDSARGASNLEKSRSQPEAGPDDEDLAQGKRPPMRRSATGWTKLRQRIVGQKTTTPRLAKPFDGHKLTTELSLGTLPMVMLKMGLIDRDEHGQRRIPVLLNFLRLQITDSIYPTHDRHAVFRIELEYGDGLMKWVIYREMKDFTNLHAHYRVANLRHGIGKFPSFPKATLTHGINFLKSDDKKQSSKAAFAKAQREGLEDYLLKLIRATMFGSGANRLCKFLEISSLAIALASHGELGKQGYLRITSSSGGRKKPSGFHPFVVKASHDSKWFIVRDSYIAAVEDPAGTEVYDVFLIDSSFSIERPKRVYRQGFSLFSAPTDSDPALMQNLENDDRLKDELEGQGPQGHNGAGDPLDPSTTDLAKTDPDRFKDSSNHTFVLVSSERRLRLIAKTERQQDQFIKSIEHVVARSIWAGKNRFDSFAPIRLNASATWLVDGRDYFWSLSRAILLAKRTIHIHDWWLSPELYLRRPPAENEEWRLDRLLQRKAREGVKIYVIVYREVSDSFTPVDSTHTKTSLRSLHENVQIQRSPSHTSTGTILWSHHEKMCVIDETIAFMGGLDLCFGRWDTPGHVLIDDEPGEPIWPGKDYSNSRVLDFKELDKPFEDQFDRNKVPRQPWHDIGVQLIGQPARDLCRHFIQRWNQLLRTKNHTVHMPFLLPPPDFTARELQQLGITGTCEVQICRSVGPWSMGIDHVEHSIQTAYLKAISLSEHFVYIENQFFSTSCEVEGTSITNKIGDALVSRIIQAHHSGQEWRAVIVIPLVPGYTFPIDHESAGSVRCIMECQARSIAQGENSIFARLRREGINPDDYITFYSLRGWGKFKSGALTTEAVYIHAKAFIADDRIVIIGSANINERSMRGDRDSELACVVRDTDLIESRMGGKPYKAGRFARSLRIRLMKEHCGVDVESEEEVVPSDQPAPEAMADDEDAWDPDHEQKRGADPNDVTRKGRSAGWARRAVDATASNAGNVASGVIEVAGLGLSRGQERIGKIGEKLLKLDNIGDAREAVETDADRIVDGKDPMKGFAGTVVPTMEEKVLAEAGGIKKLDDTRQLPSTDAAGVEVDGEKVQPLAPKVIKENGTTTIVDDSSAPPDITGPRSLPPIDTSSSTSNSSSSARTNANEFAAQHNTLADTLRKNLAEKFNAYLPIPKQQISSDSFVDPLEFHAQFMATAVRNTQAFRKVFRCVPDDLVSTWAQYREFQSWADRHNKPPKDVVPEGKEAPFFDSAHHSGQHGSGGGGTGGGSMGQGLSATEGTGEPATRRTRSASFAQLLSPKDKDSPGGRRIASASSASEPLEHAHAHTHGFPEFERQKMEECLEEVQGHLVVYPTRFLEVESSGGNFLFARDRLPPISIYN